MLDRLDREWLETNGLGDFASSTLAGINTRPYHGLLTAATQPPVGRMVLLSKVEETIVIDGVGIVNLREIHSRHHWRVVGDSGVRLPYVVVTETAFCLS